MLEAAGLEAVKKAGEAALNRTAEVNIQGELARQMAQQEAFRVGELSRPELRDIGSLREREAAAATDIRTSLSPETYRLESARALSEEDLPASDHNPEAGSQTDSLDDSLRDSSARDPEHTVGDADVGRETEKPQIVQNKEDGCRREEEAIDALKEQYPEEDGYRILRERDLVDSSGMPVKDPAPGDGKHAEGRRIDIVVVDREGKVVDSIEVTSKTAPKDDQMAKEQRIRESGGTFVRDPDTGDLYDISQTPTRVERRA